MFLAALTITRLTNIALIIIFLTITAFLPATAIITCRQWFQL
jgi:hypothetical protein